MRWQDRERGKGITRTPKEGKDEEMESGDTWVCPYVPSSHGWVKVSQGKWRAGLGKGLEQTSLWKIVEAPISLPMACAHSAHGMFPLCPSSWQGGSHDILQPLLLVLHSPAQGWRKPHCLHLPSFLRGEKHKSNVIQGWMTQGLRRGKHFQGSGHC